MQFTLGYHQTELFPEASTDGAPLFQMAEEPTPAEKAAAAVTQAEAAHLIAREAYQKAFYASPHSKETAAAAADEARLYQTVKTARKILNGYRFQ